MVRGSILSRCATVHYPSTEQSKYYNCTVNLGQTQIFYKVNETCLTRTKHDPGDLVDPTWSGEARPWHVVQGSDLLRTQCLQLCGWNVINVREDYVT